MQSRRELAGFGMRSRIELAVIPAAIFCRIASQFLKRDHHLPKELRRRVWFAFQAHTSLSALVIDNRTSREILNRVNGFVENITFFLFCNKLTSA